MSTQARRYQTFITGKAAQESYKVNGVKFDGIKNGVLIDAKSGYTNFVTKEGKFHEFFQGQESIIKQARRQIAAANGMPIEWHFENEIVRKTFEELFKKENILEITLKHTPIP